LKILILIIFYIKTIYISILYLNIYLEKKNTNSDSNLEEKNPKKLDSKLFYLFIDI